MFNASSKPLVSINIHLPVGSNAYTNNPIKIKAGEPVRVYLLNMIEFDPAKLKTSQQYRVFPSR
jgi:hypothetical protein